MTGWVARALVLAATAAAAGGCRRATPIAVASASDGASAERRFARRDTDCGTRGSGTGGAPTAAPP